jgi:alpha-mannosidase
MASVPTELTQFESPYFVDIHRPRQHTALLCGGLPYHRRMGPRKLDTLLVVHGETARSFRLGIGIDVPQPLSAALGLLAPPVVLPEQRSPPTPSGWLFHLDCRNVLATHWEPLEADAVNGFRVRLLETEGRGVQLHLRCFRAVRWARKINPDDMPPTELTVVGDRIEVFVGPHQWIELEASFGGVAP